MKTAHVIRDALESLKGGDQQLQECNYVGSVECYNKALKLLKSLPYSADFDRRAFEATCQAGLSAAYGRMRKHRESLSAAMQALLFYDECGERYPAETGRWLMAVVNQGTALAALGVLAGALETYQRAIDLFTKKGLDTPQNKQWLETLNENIATLKAHIEEKQR